MLKKAIYNLIRKAVRDEINNTRILIRGEIDACEFFKEKSVVEAVHQSIRPGDHILTGVVSPPLFLKGSSGAPYKVKRSLSSSKRRTSRSA